MMTIWQAKKGSASEPKLHWKRRDLSHQHFSDTMGPCAEYKVKKGDLMLIYWPAHQLYMGIQEAAEDGPHELSRSIPGAQDWPWGLKVAWGLKVTGHWWIRDPSNGIPFHVAGSHIKRQNPARMGLCKTDGWPPEGRDWIIEEIKNRGEDPQEWDW